MTKEELQELDEQIQGGCYEIESECVEVYNEDGEVKWIFEMSVRYEKEEADDFGFVYRYGGYYPDKITIKSKCYDEIGLSKEAEDILWDELDEYCNRLDNE